jgi:hypothetical protein
MEVRHEHNELIPRIKHTKEGVIMTKKRNNNTTGEQKPVEVDQKTKEPEQIEQPINEGAEINRLLDEGYSVKQIIDLGFKRRTAYHYAKLRMQPENEPAGTGQGDGPSGLASKGKQELIKLGSKDVIPPEAVLEVLHLPRNGDAVEVWRRGVLDGVGILLLGARYSQLTAAGQAEVVKNQLDIMREAKEGSREIAQAAADQAARTVGGQVIDMVCQASKPESTNPFASMLSQTIQPYIADMFSRMFGMFASFGQPPGMMPPQPGMPPAGQPAQPGMAQGQPASFSGPDNQISKEEMEDIFNGE